MIRFHICVNISNKVNNLNNYIWQYNCISELLLFMCQINNNNDKLLVQYHIYYFLINMIVNSLVLYSYCGKVISWQINYWMLYNWYQTIVIHV